MEERKFASCSSYVFRKNTVSFEKHKNWRQTIILILAALAIISFYTYFIHVRSY